MSIFQQHVISPLLYNVSSSGAKKKTKKNSLLHGFARKQKPKRKNERDTEVQRKIGSKEPEIFIILHTFHNSVLGDHVPSSTISKQAVTRDTGIHILSSCINHSKTITTYQSWTSTGKIIVMVTSEVKMDIEGGRGTFQLSSLLLLLW